MAARCVEHPRKSVLRGRGLTLSEGTAIRFGSFSGLEKLISGGLPETRGLLMARFAHWINVDGHSSGTCCSIVAITRASWHSISSCMMAKITAVKACKFSLQPLRDAIQFEALGYVSRLRDFLFAPHCVLMAHQRSRAPVGLS